MPSMPSYAERLRVPLRWWVQATMFLATFWLAFIVATPAWVAWAATAALVALTGGTFLAWGSARIEVRDGQLVAGRAHIGLAHVGVVEALDARQSRAAAGVDADARAYLLLRPYLKRSVRVQITDPADPTPYWLVSTRRPHAIVAAIDAATDGRTTSSL
jgi:hypothetical protein